jgi:tetratricopeptide (TPR) repeat protein
MEADDDEVLFFTGENEESNDTLLDEELLAEVEKEFESQSSQQPTEPEGRKKRKKPQPIPLDYDAVQERTSKSTPKKAKKPIPQPRAKKMTPEIEYLLSEAQQNFITGNFPKAVDELLEVVRQEPKLKLPYVTLSLIYEEQNDLETAVSFLMIAAQISNDDYELWADVGRKSSELGNIRQVGINHKQKSGQDH